jgi:hypothetical protein
MAAREKYTIFGNHQLFRFSNPAYDLIKQGDVENDLLNQIASTRES